MSTINELMKDANPVIHTLSANSAEAPDDPGNVPPGSDPGPDR